VSEPYPAIRSEADTFPVVAIGASAGGLDACRKLLDALPDASGMAIILVQHLDPSHPSMMVELLAQHTAMRVSQAVEGAIIQRNHLYVIAPGSYLLTKQGALHVVPPTVRHGARLPFDFLLHSLATDFRARAVCVVLSGTGSDGSLGLQSIKDMGGLVVAQCNDEAGYDGMPSNAVGTGGVRHVLPVAGIAKLLVARAGELASGEVMTDAAAGHGVEDALPQIIDLLRNQTANDFSLYKQGTLQRRIERRMALLSLGRDKAMAYLQVLQGDRAELERLAKDLLIHVTSFFRDPKVFDHLTKTIIPDMVRDHVPDQPLRIWIAGCSTGEEAYSLAILFREQIAQEKRSIKLQVFASDVDADAIAIARDGLYAESTVGDVSQERLARFFTREGNHYKVSPDLRASVIFTVQDVLADPPFSRLDFVSCRNLLIYLGAEAQAKVVALFHFALRESGILLLGSAETVGSLEGRFEIISKQDRLYRTVGRSRLRDVGRLKASSDSGGVLRTGQIEAPAKQVAMAELCKRLVLETFAPAAILINAKNECVYSLGPTHRYLRLAQGHPTQDILAMAQGGLRTKLRSAIHQAATPQKVVVVPGGQVDRDGSLVDFDINIRSISDGGDAHMLVCFVEGKTRSIIPVRSPLPIEVARVAELESELEATRTELQGAIHNLELSGEEQKAINEEALSVNEEYQSTNEELLTSKEELQSLNEELTALNGQLQETLDRQRTTANDLQNILFSTDVATLFLDTGLNIRFYTPATRSLFNVIPTDVGRPLADLNSLSADTALTDDARSVLTSLAPIEREIETQRDIWFIRRILPYRTQDDKVEGVVITFTDVSERKSIKKDLEEAKHEAEQATIAKSRFLAAASHDLRQPLQTLTLLQALLVRCVDGEKAPKLVAKVGDTLAAMSGMLNTLLDINQIEAGVVQATPITFPINDLLQRMRDEFTYHAQAQNLELRVVPCGLHVHSDPALLEQMLRNLLSNALKYTKAGKILLGCRRRRGDVSIEIWDSGIGIPETELQTIFEEYHQLDNDARVRSRGLGLGLTIVKRLVKLLGHQIHVHSRLGKGSVFAVTVQSGKPVGKGSTASTVVTEPGPAPRPKSKILVIEDEPDLRDLLTEFLSTEGYEVSSAPDGAFAFDLIETGRLKPELVIADYNLPHGISGLHIAIQLRKNFGVQFPVIIVTGDITTSTMREVELQKCIRLNKPVNQVDMLQAIRQALQQRPTAVPTPLSILKQGYKAGVETIYVVDDDAAIGEGFQSVLESEGYNVSTHVTCESFIESYQPGKSGCLLVDAYLPGMSGLELMHRLRDAGDQLPIIMITGSSDVPTAVEAMKMGASDFLEKPIAAPELLAGIVRAMERSRDAEKAKAWRESAANHIGGLTARQRQIMDMVLAGHPSKNIAADLGISQRTVENHRALIMKKTGAKSLPALARLAIAAG
jgi:two-component system CheB/CheR fusion protein